VKICKTLREFKSRNVSLTPLALAMNFAFFDVIAAVAGMGSENSHSILMIIIYFIDKEVGLE
jgi:hypothetical protein